MKKLLMLVLVISSIQANAQSENEDDNKPFFTKEKLFAGGSLGLGFTSYQFSVGVGPFIGYSFTKYLDAGIALNYNYVSERDPNSPAKIRQSVIGPGGFVRIFPLNFLYLQGQYEFNSIKITQIDGGSLPNIITKYNVPSLLLGVGYTSEREAGRPFYFVSIFVDVANNNHSPYKDGYNRADPVFRTGVNFPLFSGSGGGSNREARRSRRGN